MSAFLSWRPKADRRKSAQCGGEQHQNSTLQSARGPFPSYPESKPYTTPLPVALILGPTPGLTPSTRKGSATQACGRYDFAFAVIAALGRTHRAPVEREWFPPQRREQRKCLKPSTPHTSVDGASPRLSWIASSYFGQETTTSASCRRWNMMATWRSSCTNSILTDGEDMATEASQGRTPFGAEFV